jgi:hemerythrin-like domain-containing protein
MNAIEFLKQQHKEALGLIQSLKEAEDTDEKQQLFDRCADTIALHFLIEEQSFYPQVKNDQTEDMLLEAVEEHLAGKRVLADLLDCDVDDKTFPAKLEVLEVTVQHHIAEEEQQMFPMLEKLFAKKLEAIGDDLQDTEQELLGQGDLKSQIPEQTETAASLS